MQRYFSHICDGTDVQANWRRSCTYGRSPNAIDISQGSLTYPSHTDTGPPFLYGDSDTPPHLVSFYDTIGIRRTYSRLKQNEQTVEWYDVAINSTTYCRLHIRFDCLMVTALDLRFRGRKFKSRYGYEFLCPRIEWSGAYCFCPLCMFVCLFVCLSVCLLSTLTFALTFEP